MVPKATCLLPETGHEEKVDLLYHYATQVKDDTRFPQCHPFSSTLRFKTSLPSVCELFQQQFLYHSNCKLQP